jgi:hypothetical protein
VRCTGIKLIGQNGPINFCEASYSILSDMGMQNMVKLIVNFSANVLYTKLFVNMDAHLNTQSKDTTTVFLNINEILYLDVPISIGQQGFADLSSLFYNGYLNNLVRFQISNFELEP